MITKLMNILSNKPYHFIYLYKRIHCKKLLFGVSLKKILMRKGVEMMSNTQNTNRAEESTSRAITYPLLIVMSIIPLIVHQKQYANHLDGYSWFTFETTSNDFFLYYKSVALIAMAAIMLIILCLKIKANKQYQLIPKFLIPLGLYGLFIIISMIFSINPTFSLHGSMDQFESGFVLLSYLIFMYYAYLLIETEDSLEFLIKVWLISMGVLCIIGLLQVLGHDFFATTIGKRLILIKSYWDHLDAIDFAFGKNRIYLTLYNPNYVGVYATLAIPVLATLLLFSKKISMRIIYSILIIGMVICIVGSESKTAFITLGVVVLFALLLFRKHIIKYWKFLIPGIIVLIIVFFVFDASINHSYTNSIKNAIKSLHTENKPTVTRIDTLDNEIVINNLENPLHIQYYRNDTDYSFVVKDDDGKVLSTYNSENEMFIDDDRFKNIQLSPILIEETYGIKVTVDGATNYYFSNEAIEGNTGYYFYTPYGKWDKINNPDIFNMNQSMFSGRGYIWSRTIPQLKHYIIKGSGPDTFTLVFPQDDYIGLQNNGYLGSIVTKPHNLFLQIAVQTGVLSLIAFLILYIIYFVQSITLYMKHNFNSYFSQVGVGIFLSTIGYMIAGITNDSTVGVAPIFWILLGLGFGINRRLKLSKN